MEIHKNECALRKLSKFHVSKDFQLRRLSIVYICIAIVDVHTHFTRAVIMILQCSKQRRSTSQHDIIATYYRSVKLLIKN